jgi:branched-chain amino acid transport system ATP-binding protein
MLSVTDLHVAYDGTEVVHGVSLEVGRAEVVALIGSNGAGKSTVLRAICGLERPRAGTVVVDGADITGWAAHRVARAGVAYVPAERHLFPGMRVRDNLELGAYPRRPDRDRLDHVLTLFPRLRERRRQFAGTLSGGEQQMLAVARALMAGPDLLLLDEPTTGLAPGLAGEAYAALGQLRAESSLTILVAEQQVPLALELADRGVVLEDGRVQLEGTSAALAQDPEVRRAYLGLA